MIIAYVGPVPYPSNRADAQRMSGIAEALRGEGHRVLVGSGHVDSNIPSSGLRDTINLGELPREEQNKVGRIIIGLTWGGRTLRWLRGLDPQPDLILVYGNHFGYLGRLWFWRKISGTPVVCDLTEWYEPIHLPGGRFGPASILQSITMRAIVPRLDGVIAVSGYLSAKYIARRMKVLQVPPLFSISEPVQTRSKSDVLRLCYAGSPGAKDAKTLRNLEVLPALLGDFKQKVRIDVVGVDRPAKARTGDPDNTSCIHYHGKVSLEEAREFVSDADAIVLQRPDMRYAQAGFPSKVVESLMLGTPVIANPVGELAHIIDQRNGVTLEDDSPEALQTVVEHLLVEGWRGATQAEIAQSARVQFSPKSWGPRLTAFLANVAAD